MSQGHGHQHDHEDPHRIPITIDRKPYKAPTTPMTGAELRALAEPDVPADRDLWLEVPGPADDELITAGRTLGLRPGMDFYTAPRTINPGQGKHATAGR